MAADDSVVEVVVVVEMGVVALAFFGLKGLEEMEPLNPSGNNDSSISSMLDKISFSKSVVDSVDVDVVDNLYPGGRKCETSSCFRLEK